MSFEYVDLPSMGLRVPVIRVLFRIFGQEIYTYAVIIALSVVLMIILGLRHAERYGMKQEDIIDFMIFALPASIICARLYYVAFTWDHYRDNPLDILNIRQGGIAIYGSVIGAFATLIIFSKIRKIDALKFLDFGVPYLLLSQGIGRWGNFVNQEVFGANTSLPWGMTSPQISAYLASNAQWLSTLGVTVDPMKPVHPTFLYESLWNILITCILFWLRRRRKYKGETLLGYLIGYGAGRAFIEGLRTDSLMLGGFRVSQLISVLVVAVCLAIIIFFHSKFKRYEELETVSEGAAGQEDTESEDGEPDEDEPDEDEQDEDEPDGDEPDESELDDNEPDGDIPDEPDGQDATAPDGSRPDIGKPDGDEQDEDEPDDFKPNADDPETEKPDTDSAESATTDSAAADSTEKTE